MRSSTARRFRRIEREFGLWTFAFGRFLQHLAFSLHPFSSFRLARPAGRGFTGSMSNRDDADSRWSAAGELLLWVLFFFWAVWIFNAFLPPKSDQTVFETYLGQQFGAPGGGAGGGPAAGPSRMPGNGSGDSGDQKSGPGGPWR